ncbi:MAG TPA: amidohydrolase [Desulfobacterales bacterium]|nr:amidohydrolase [Desulfobacterales bacterium]
MRDLKTTLVQTDLGWEDIEYNLAALDDKIDRLREETDLIVLPEMFTTGFTMNAGHLAQDMAGPSVKWMRDKSRQKNADIVGSLIIRENGKYFNRLIWAKPEGTIFAYDKRHLFRMAHEDSIYSAGHKTLTVELNGWKIRPFVCYDLRFPVWTRNIANQYDVAVFIANWPEKRSSHWTLLLKARAVENQCYVIGVNRVGVDGKGYSYSGDSSIIDPTGKVVFQKRNEVCAHTTAIPYSPLLLYRDKFPAWKDADTFKIEISA